MRSRMLPSIKMLFEMAYRLTLYALGRRSIVICEQSDARLILRSNFTHVVVDRSQCIVAVGSRTKVKFEAIKSIDIVHRRATSDWPDLWTIRLNVSWHSSPVVGQTTEAVDASIAAARIATLT